MTGPVPGDPGTSWNSTRRPEQPEGRPFPRDLRSDRARRPDRQSKEGVRYCAWRTR